MKKSDMDSPQIVCFGEMLYDYLPEGRFPGGAPMNVALHLQQLGVDAQFISSVGEDEDGTSLLNYLQARGLPTDLIQIDEVYPTGKVMADVTQSDDVKYDILHPTAWDYIGLDAAVADAVETADLFLYGSLAARDDTSRNTLEELLRLAPRTAFDINLRSPYYTKAGITPLLEQANILKMNEDEFALLAGWYLNATPSEDSMYRMADQFSLDTVCITRGANGATLLTQGQCWHQHGFAVNVADTIGSGDAFLATLLSKLLWGDPPPECLRYACAVGAFVASQPGATPLLDTSAVEEILHS